MGLDKVPIGDTSATFNLDWIFSKIDDINAQQLDTQAKLINQMLAFENDEVVFPQ
jgi:hypothetical protein